MQPTCRTTSWSWGRVPWHVLQLPCMLPIKWGQRQHWPQMAVVMGAGVEGRQDPPAPTGEPLMQREHWAGVETRV